MVIPEYYYWGYNMKRLGVVDVVSRRGVALVKPFTLGRNILSIVNASIYDENFRRIGKVVDIIGNTMDPRIVVKIEKPDMVVTDGSIVYYYQEITRKRRSSR